MIARLVTAMALATALILGGCAADPSARRARHADHLASSNLVLPTDEMIELASADSFDPRLDDDGWSFGRNDDRLGSAAAGFPTLQFVEIRQRDYQYTLNGRPREYSTTRTLSIKRGAVVR